MNVRLIVTSLAFALAACASVQRPAPTASVPEALKPGANEAMAAIVAARGVQIYECRAKADQAGAYEWAFVAPEAELFDTSGRKVGKHYAGPTWEASDGSRIAGTVKARSDAPHAGAIPWLLMTAKSVGPQGAFSNITSVQRVNTTGGVAPDSGCSQAVIGTRMRVPYTADYYLLAQKS